MSVTSSITVTVPATTANLGAGFDCIGAAFTLYNQFKFTLLSDGETEITVTGKEAERVNTNIQDNLLYEAFVKLYSHLGKNPPPVKMEIALAVPLARGLGSSATAIVGGLVGANALAGEPLSQVEVMDLAIEMEGHPDNVVPALIGGCRLAATGAAGWEICDIPWHESIVPVVAIPDFELSTVEARRVLPKEISRADAIFNISHLGLLLRGLETGKQNWLQAALQDKLHQPYRKSLIQGYDDVSSAAIFAGALGMVISGAGPTLLALTDTRNAVDVVVAMASAWQELGIKAEVRSLAIDTHGAKVIKGSGE
ncbi:homoserine kinase [Calothrix sp. UHCC 0171]|uniref:homoserine kinase n=1 Tax=Calothrix sp. UHCC 0171 TaxID=3110245 RepID=UPI002B220856|nr:homoserine kinase [Calothrix sp. UHCC 0171]MEA5574038.1 homoserine kinase [Calothrix sp. UHCC 0171]